MTKKALLFGSIGAVAETSDIQRRAYNAALKENGVDWEWSPETYSRLLGSSGGKERLDLLSAATGRNLSDAEIDAIHARKTEIACDEVRSSGQVSLRPGVAALARRAKEAGMKLGFVTTTYRPNVDALLDASNGELSESDLDVIVVRDDVERGKPAPDAYVSALERLGISASEAVAIEDTENSVLSAKRAGLTVIATPGAFTAGQDTSQADLTLDALGGPDGVDSRVIDLIDA
ncbi:MAG: HAD-IA family hydrolase [Litorimonas sp.]